jgi:hypothetical protein
MSQRESTLVWLRDTLEHLAGCESQLEWADDPEIIGVLLESMMRDLGCCQRLCTSLQERYKLQHVV